MKISKNKHIVLFFIGLSLILIALLLELMPSKGDVLLLRDYNYSLKYFAGYIGGAEYNISVYNDTVKISKQEFCINANCENKVPTTYELRLKEENIIKFENFIANNFNARKEIEISESKMNEYEKGIINSIISLDENEFELAIEEYKYRIVYQDYNIYLKKDGTILIKHLDNDIISSYQLEFSEDKMTVSKDYLSVFLSNYDTNVIVIDKPISKKDSLFMKSIVENKDSILDNIENIANLVYIINVNYNYLYLYDDDTYEYYSNNEYVKSSKYSINVDEILEYESNLIDSDNMYTLNIDKTKYNISSNNEVIQEFLGSIGINLEE